MSWRRAGEIAGQIAEGYARTSYLVTTERREAFRESLLALDQALLTEWLHHRLAQEFRAFRATCNLHAQAAETVPDIPSLLRKIPP